MDHDGSIEPEMEQIGPAVVELQYLQGIGCMTGIPARAQWANDHAIAHLRAKMVPQNLR